MVSLAGTRLIPFHSSNTTAYASVNAVVSEVLLGRLFAVPHIGAAKVRQNTTAAHTLALQTCVLVAVLGPGIPAHTKDMFLVPVSVQVVPGRMEEFAVPIDRSIAMGLE